jgi:hypothetical protein
MLMRTSQRRNHFIQLDLFCPQPTRPRWKALPQEVRQRVLPMLVRLLKDHRFAQPASDGRKGVSDE